MSLRVLVVSIAPLFPGAVHGGSQRVLTEVARALGEAGHRIRIVCSERPENAGGFELSPGIAVEPVMKLKGFFPDPYEVPPHRLAAAALELRPLLEWAERIYLHADIFHFRGLLPPGVPVVRSFHDFHYETALVSAFAYSADVTIVPSEYLRRCIQATVGASGLRELEPIEVVPNGIDLGAYRPAGASSNIPRADSRARNRKIVLLHPHRPDPRKGIEQALRLLSELRERHRRSLELLVPRHVDAEKDAAVGEYYDGIGRRAGELGVGDSVAFHPWLDQRGMPALYRSADVTLCPGNFIESFGLTAYESLACGIPVVAARVGALRDLPELPDVYLHEWDDVRAMADAVIIAARGMKDAPRARQVLADVFSLRAMMAAYVRIIESAKASSGDHREPRPSTVGYQLAPWCHLAGGRIYNDYAYRHLELPHLYRAIADLTRAGTGAASGAGAGPGFKLEAIRGTGVPESEVEEALTTGTLIQVTGRPG